MNTAIFHEKPFDEETLCKLDIYRQYLRSWLPVFLNQGKRIRNIQIFDFFAGPGRDAVGQSGSPLIASEEISHALSQNASRLNSKQEIHLFLNEPDNTRYEILDKETIPKIKTHNPTLTVHLAKEKFCSLFPKGIHLMNSQGVANFVFLDQFGIKETTREVLQAIWRCPTTDMMFFISSTCVNRFKQDPNLRQYIPTITDEEYSMMNGNNATRILYDAYSRWIPKEIDYYLGQFSIKRNANIYGLLFGSRHPLGMEKFLRVAWDKDKLHGEANFDIDGEGLSENQLMLFEEMGNPRKLMKFENGLKFALENHTLKTNKDLYLYGLRNGVLSKHVQHAISKLQKAGFLPKQKLSISYDAWNKTDMTQVIHF